jgi:hypothetical protein
MYPLRLKLVHVGRRVGRNYPAMLPTPTSGTFLLNIKSLWVFLSKKLTHHNTVPRNVRAGLPGDLGTFSHSAGQAGYAVGHAVGRG